MKDNRNGICLNQSQDCTISQNTIANNTKDGIRLHASTNNTIEDNRLIGNDAGTSMVYSGQECDGRQ